MAARSHAAAQCSSLRYAVWLFVWLLLSVWNASCSATYIYGNYELMEIGMQSKQAVTAEFLHLQKMPEEIARAPGSPWNVFPVRWNVGRRRRRRERKQRRGCRAGVLVRLRNSSKKKLPLPSIFLANVRSLVNKVDELRLQARTSRFVKDCCVMLITETWLHSAIPETAVELAGFTTHRSDRSRDSGKSKGGGVCMYVNNSWCTNTKIIDSHCSRDLEYMTVRCRPLYLPREFTVVVITVVYIPPDANANSALGHLSDAVSSQQNRFPDAGHIIAGDFNHVDLRGILPKFHQQVNCATRGENTLDKAYSNIKNGYRALQLPHLGQSDHMSLLLAPAYISLRKQTKSITKTVKQWPEGALEQLQDCFETNWDIFDHPNLDEYTETVLGYIKHCIDTVTVDKCVRTYPNQKPWMTKEVKRLLHDRNKAFKSGDRLEYSVARANLKRGIKQAKEDYKRKIEACFYSNNTRQVWQGVQEITNYRGKNMTPTGGDASLAEELNKFFARFETEQTEVVISQPPVHQRPFLLVEEQEVRKTLRAVNPRKAAGPDGIPGRVIKDCADQLAGVFTKIFNRSLTQSIIPTCLKASVIVPLPKKPSISSLNDYRPVALTSILMKCLEQLVRRYIISCLSETFDRYQFAYRANRSTEDAIDITLHTALTHLEQRGTYVRMLFVDFSSAFNTIIPYKLVSKLKDLGFPNSICSWIMDFLSNRSQRVRLGNYTSSALNLNTGTPQGCVLSPLLFTIYTSDCTHNHPQNKIIKFADDTTVVGLISEGDESAYREEVQQLVQWCRDNNLILNVNKTKEFIIDYRKRKSEIQPLTIDGDDVEQVTDCRFLGVTMKEDLTWSENTVTLVKKAQQRLYFLRLLRKQHLSEKLLVTFYRSCIETTLTYCLCVWFASCTAADRKALQGVINTAQRIIGCPLPSLKELYSSRCTKKTSKILKDPSHPGHQFFELLPSGRRYRVIRSRTNRLKTSFYHTTVVRLNSTV